VLRLLLVVLLIFSVTPMASETIELVVHAVNHGDLAHGHAGDTGDTGEDENDSHDEHGCSSLFHMCACHSSAPSTVAHARAWRPAAPALLDRFRPVGPASSAGRGAEAPPHRPPIA
jgi:hypothetical protein